MDMMSDTASKPRLLVFEYNILLDDSFFWDLLFSKASCLLDALHEHCEALEVALNPFIFDAEQQLLTCSLE